MVALIPKNDDKRRDAAFDAGVAAAAARLASSSAVTPAARIRLEEAFAKHADRGRLVDLGCDAIEFFNLMCGFRREGHFQEKPGEVAGRLEQLAKAYENLARAHAELGFDSGREARRAARIDPAKWHDGSHVDELRAIARRCRGFAKTYRTIASKHRREPDAVARYTVEHLAQAFGQDLEVDFAPDFAKLAQLVLELCGSGINIYDWQKSIRKRREKVVNPVLPPLINE